VLALGCFRLDRLHAAPASGQKLLSLALALVMGGALGNVIDRMRFGAVVDFIQWHAAGFYWPAFNVADSAITVGALAAPQGAFVTLHGADGYTTNLPSVALLDDDVLVAHSFEDAPLSDDHGGPVRLMVPKRYGWKSAKWLSGIEFHAEDRPGYWEVRGYHNEADPWKEERYSDD
jgi:hypothetical protein